MFTYDQVKHISGGWLDSNLVLEGQKMLGSTSAFGCVFPTLRRGPEGLEGGDAIREPPGDA